MSLQQLFHEIGKRQREKARQRLSWTYSLCCLAVLGATLGYSQQPPSSIRDVVYSVDGQPFTGTLEVVSKPITDEKTSARFSVPIEDGLFSIQLPAADGESSYTATFTSRRTADRWEETWRVPAVKRGLYLRDVRTSAAKDVSLPIAIGDVSGLTAALSQINNSLSSLSSTLSVANASLQANGSAPRVRGEVLTPAAGSGSVFTLSTVPDPLSLVVHRNGLRQAPGQDYSVNGAQISFLGASLPQSGDLLVADYRPALTASATAASSPAPRAVNLPIPISGVSGLSTALNQINSQINTLTTTAASLSGQVQQLAAIQAAIGETPAGAIDGTNTTFVLQKSPLSVSSLAVYRNGVRLSSGVDFTLNGKTIVFVSGALPQTGDLLCADYQYTN